MFRPRSLAPFECFSLLQFTWITNEAKIRGTSNKLNGGWNTLVMTIWFSWKVHGFCLATVTKNGSVVFVSVILVAAYASAPAVVVFVIIAYNMWMRVSVFIWVCVCCLCREVEQRIWLISWARFVKFHWMASAQNNQSIRARVHH